MTPSSTEPRERRAKARPDPLSAASIARLAVDEVGQLTGKETLGVVSVEPADDRGWVIGVEVVEERRIPSSADMLGLYLVELDDDGELLACHRDRRYLRGSTDAKVG
ncbi:gas vesicle protein GvpO [Dactylosporangium sp. NPDC049742]|uniref:gas vesicle protein GvpO n=1 Tax=Dactylosporangium sp. NPDC049742 TaxID=3154737 RepID=UPI003439605F